MKQPKIRCPHCNKHMIWHKRVQDFWWSCSGYPRCKVSTRDCRGRPNFLDASQLVKAEFLNQLTFITSDVKDLRTQILVRLIKSKGSLQALPEKYSPLYHKLIEPLMTSTVFAKCHRCTSTLDAEDSLKLEEDKYLCDWCWGH